MEERVQLAETVPFPAKQDRTEFSVLIDRVRDLKPAFRDAARDTENNRRVAKTSMDRLRDAEITKLMRPARFGGFEYGLAELVQVAFEFGSACGSTGWCGSLAICYQWMASYFPLEAQCEVWSDPDNLVASSFAPSKDCNVVPGGLRIAGAWPYASNCENSQWLMLGAAVPDSKGPPDVMWCLVPIAEMVIDQDIMVHQRPARNRKQDRAHRYAGFRARAQAGSVCRHCCRDNSGHQDRKQQHESSQLRHLRPIALASPVLGMAQGALDAFIQMAATKCARRSRVP